MDILDAWDVLHKYYPKTDLDSLYRRKKFDGSETDTNRKWGYNAELLREKAMRTRDLEEQSRLYAAAKAFERIAREAWEQR